MRETAEEIGRRVGWAKGAAMTKDARVTLRVDSAALATVEKLAADEQRSVSQMLRLLLSEALKARVARKP